MDEPEGNAADVYRVMKLDCSIPIRRDSRVIDLTSSEFFVRFSEVLYVLLSGFENSTVDREWPDWAKSVDSEGSEKCREEPSASSLQKCP